MKYRNILFIVLSLSLLIVSTTEAIDKQEAISKFVLGNEAYKEGGYPEAIAHYESIIEGERESGQIYYNLGNAYFKSGQLGYAILNYQRASEFIPRDSDLIFNSKYAETLIKNTIAEDPPFFISKVMENHISFYTIDEAVIIITILFILLGVTFLLARFFKWSKPTRWLSRSAIIIFLLIYSLGLMMKLHQREDLAVIVRETAANFEPSLSATSHFELSEGMRVKIVKYKDDWVKIRRNDGRLGWIEKISVKEI